MQEISTLAAQIIAKASDAMKTAPNHRMAAHRYLFKNQSAVVVSGSIYFTKTHQLRKY